MEFKNTKSILLSVKIEQVHRGSLLTFYTRCMHIKKRSGNAVSIITEKHSVNCPQVHSIVILAS
jgi:hypothetical protein